MSASSSGPRTARPGLARARGRPAAALAVIACAVLVALPGAGCGSAPGRVLSKLAGVERTGVVDRIEPRGDYLDLDLSEARLFVPDSAECRATLKRRRGLRYLDRGRFGRIDSSSGSCPVVGIGSLRWWRDRRPRVPVLRANPRQRADFYVRYRDSTLAMLQGRFDLAALVGFTGGADLIAVVPVTGACGSLLPGSADPAERLQTSLLEFHPSGRVPYRLVTPSGSCPVIGFIEPLEKH
ncbi:MAG: hypothetical protein ACE5IL_09840 [Myxococcota bacterium]